MSYLDIPEQSDLLTKIIVAVSEAQSNLYLPGAT